MHSGVELCALDRLTCASFRRHAKRIFDLKLAREREFASSTSKRVPSTDVLYTEAPSNDRIGASWRRCPRCIEG